MKFSFQDQGMVEVVEEFARRLPPQVEQATEGQTNSLLEMIQAGAELYGITPLQFVFWAVEALANAANCHCEYASVNRADPAIVVMGMRLREGSAPEVVKVTAYPEDEGEYK